MPEQNKDINNGQQSTNPNQKKPLIYAIIGSSEFNQQHFLGCYKNKMFTRIIAVDGGYKHLEELGITPNIAVGDFDSLGYIPYSDNVPSCIENNFEMAKSEADKMMQVMQYPQDKDKTDFELAIDEAIAHKPNFLMCYGFLGKRLDHQIGAFQMMSHTSDHRVGIFCVGLEQTAMMLDGPAEFGLRVNPDPKIDRTVSVFSYSDVCGGIDSQGLKWPFINTPLSNSMSLGVSNVIEGPEFKIRVKHGKLLVVFATDLLFLNTNEQN